MQNKIRTLKIVSVIMIILLPKPAIAREASQITDWYIKDFQSKITVNADSSLLVEESIIADCGDLPNKHGIFRVVPVQTKTENETIKTPVWLVSITDFNDKPINYSESKDNLNHTITWKIGNADSTVHGENEYKITYLVKNAVRSSNADFDELYWNLSGNFWDIEIDNFSANIIFPVEINKNNTQIYLYSGNLGSQSNISANYEWASDNILRVFSTKTLLPQQGITASIAFPKNIIAPYKQGFLEKYGDYLWFLIPFLTFIFAYLIWNKHGKDPRIDKTVVPEFEIPDNLTPMETGLLAHNGSLHNSMISATIVDLAVKKYLTIEEIDKKLWFGKNDYKLKKIADETSQQTLVRHEELIIENIFNNSKQEIMLSDLKDNFYKKLPDIKKTGNELLKNKGLIYESGLTLKSVFMVLAAALGFFAFISLGAETLLIFGALGLSAVIAIIFGLLMPKRTPKGAELNWQIKGFKLYMETAEKYRSRFYEKENIFEKFLPYAIVFGIAKLWAKKMEKIYGKEYFTNYRPAWYAGNFGAGFNADNFATQINSISAGIAANIGTSSGAHGSGGVGGGGGGGGGGGW